MSTEPASTPPPETVPVLRTWEPRTITLNGRPLHLLIKRQRVNEAADFDRLYFRAMHPEADRLIMIRKPGDEQAMVERAVLSIDRLAAYREALRFIEGAAGEAAPEEVATKLALLVREILTAVEPNEVYVISDAEIVRRRRLEMTDDQRRTYDALRQKDDEAFQVAVQTALYEYVRVPAGQLKLDEDGSLTEVTTGRHLELCLGGQVHKLLEVLALVRAVNVLGDDEKKGWRSRSTSSTGVSEPRPIPTGAPSAPVTPAASTASATPEAVAPPAATSPSGSTEQ